MGNWPVAVERRRAAWNRDVVIQDLPASYFPPTPWRKWLARGYLVNEKPDAILNIVDSTNIERNLYLTTQLIISGHPPW